MRLKRTMATNESRVYFPLSSGSIRQLKV